jgi:hypothetical protein
MNDAVFDLKADPKFPHHYIIGVVIHDMRSSQAGEMFLKYGPVHFTHEDVKKVQDAALLSVDKVFKTTSKEASEIHECRELVVALSGMRMAAASNHATLHHFSFESEISDHENWFESYVKNANKSKSIKRQLMDAKIKGY